MYEIRIWSKQPSHKTLRKEFLKSKYKLPIPSVVRLGSITKSNLHWIEINSVESIEISSDKLLMKKKFNEAGVKTAEWTTGNSLKEIQENLEKAEINYPIIAKSRNGSRGIGNTLIDDEHHLKNWTNNRDLSRYIFERYYNYALEYRLHITKNGCFYTCRKALKKDRDTSKDFQRHIDNTVWFLEDNKVQFKKPNSWDDIVNDCVKALNTIGADVLSFDVKVQGETNPKDGSKRKYQDYILIESNSASSMKSNGEGLSICAQKYLDILPKLIMEKGVVKENNNE